MVVAVTSKTIEINLPPLHNGINGKGGQIEVERDGKRFTVCICGRRWGKTTFGVRKCVKGAIETPGGIFWWVGPNYPEIQASNAWGMLKYLVRQIPGTTVREGDRYVELPNGSQVWVKSADSPDSLRGPKLSGVVCDEVAQYNESVWTEILRPALMDLKGWGLFIGTPRGKNWVWKLYEQAPMRSDWARFKRTSYDNPYIDPKEIDKLRDELSEIAFQQEIMADFGASQYLVFPEFSRGVHEWKGEVPKFTSYFGGLDFGGTEIHSHKSSGVVCGRTAQDILIWVDEFEQSGPGIGERQLTWMAESEAMMKLLAFKQDTKFHGIRWRGDRTQMWGIQLVRNMGYTIGMSKSGKDSIRETLEILHRRLKVRTEVPPGPRMYYLPRLHFIPEAFERLRYPEPREGEVIQSQNPLAVNDDTMAAMRYCVEGVDRAVIGEPQELYKGLIPSIAPDIRVISPRFKLRKKGTIIRG